MTQRSLFGTSETQPVSCAVRNCQAIRLPGQTKVVTCRFELERDTGRLGKRPRGCLNAARPDETEVPY